MAESYPSIQSFYEREIPTPAEKDEKTQSSPSKRGDGFTEEELADTLDPLKRKWNPDREYDECTIDTLIPGPKAVTFVGRIVNLSTIHGSSQKQPKAAGWHYLIVKDDTAAISVSPSPHNWLPISDSSREDQALLLSQPISSQARTASLHLDSLHLQRDESKYDRNSRSPCLCQPLPRSCRLRSSHDPHRQHDGQPLPHATHLPQRQTPSRPYDTRQLS